MYERILVALDGSELAEQVLPHVEALASKFDSTVTLLHATTPDRSLIAHEAAGMRAGGDDAGRLEMGEVLEHRASRYLGEVAQRLQTRGITVESAHEQGAPGTVIVDEARRMHTDLIAMTTAGEGGLLRALSGSVADEVVQNAPCPVLLVRIS